MSKQSRVPWPEELKDKLRELWATGMLGKQIAYELGRTERAVRQQVLVLGLPPRKRPNIPGTQRERKVITYLNVQERELLRQRSAQARLTTSAYLYQLIKRDIA